jgi:cytoskeletal protein RodZ
MEDKKSVSYLVFESITARNERHTKRLTIALVISIILIFLSNALWLYAWMQYDYSSAESTTTTTYTQDSSGINIIGDDNNVAKQKDSEDCKN